MEVIMKLPAKFAITLIAATLAASPAFAADKTLEHAQKVLDSAATSMSQAITTAEAKVGGKALSARLAQRQGEDFYDVHVLKEDKITDVHVSVADGRITEERPLERHHAANGKSMPTKGEQPGGRS